MKIVFFKRPKYKRFNYQPRYWDPEQEEFERRKKELDGVQDERNSEEVKDDLQRKIDRQWRRRHDQESVGRSNTWMRIFIYALIIFLGIYFIFFTGFINNLVRFFTA